jgi:hypothetical protein
MLLSREMDEPLLQIAARVPPSVVAELDEAVELMLDRPPELGSTGKRTRSDAVRAAIAMGLPLILAKLRLEAAHERPARNLRAR